MMPSVESSRLLKAIRAALDAHGQRAKTLRVSVADEMTWENAPGGGRVRVRWLCWSIDDSDDEEIVEPSFSVVAEEVTQERLRRELPSFFPEIDIVVDNDIGA